MSLIKKSIHEILNETAIQEGIEEYNKNSFSRWRSLANKWITDSKAYGRFRTFLFIIQILIGGASVGVGLLVKDIKTTYIAISIWGVYAALNIFINLVYRFYPDDYDNLAKEVILYLSA
ncbi:hypothetical protein QUF84_00340 [Fictibacillus enclensis]|uniref:hypothetical protein n=1 Tax=Fictibacillus enclensis TaxID=1017270 RepID=UPI00259FE276|nr:hypothetical protein [Fictibacillus enclensis]MDM5335744.1 hypothetical protein [Fictibacillus enclensis]